MNETASQAETEAESIDVEQTEAAEDARAATVILGLMGIIATSAATPGAAMLLAGSTTGWYQVSGIVMGYGVGLLMIFAAGYAMKEAEVSG